MFMLISRPDLATRILRNLNGSQREGRQIPDGHRLERQKEPSVFRQVDVAGLSKIFLPVSAGRFFRFQRLVVGGGLYGFVGWLEGLAV